MLLIVGGVFLVAGVFLGFSASKQLGHARASSEWPTVSGKVLSSEVRTKRSRTSGSRKHGSRSRTTYHAEVHYEYTVDGRPYTADRVQFGEYGSDNSSHAREIVARYAEGKQVSVHYDPTQPDLAVLEPGVHGGINIQFGLAGLFTLVGAGICAAGVWSLLRRMSGSSEEADFPVA